MTLDFRERKFYQKMKTILSSETMGIPDEIQIKVHAKIIEVEGPRGKLTRNFKHLNLYFKLITDEETGKRKAIEIWNFLGEKRVPLGFN